MELGVMLGYRSRRNRSSEPAMSEESITLE